MKPPFFLRIAIVCCLSASLHAEQNVSPASSDALLKEIDALEEKQKQVKTKGRDDAIRKIRAVVLNGPAAANLYEEAVEAMQFQGKKGKVTDYSAWKNQYHDALQSKEVKTSLLLHLRYLLLSLQRSGSENPEIFVPETLAYIRELVARDELVTVDTSFVPEQPKKTKAEADLEKQKQQVDKFLADLLDKPLAQSPFVEWLRVGEWLPDGKSWEEQPGNVAGILEKNVRPVFRAAKDPKLIEVWDYQIKVEADRITAGRSSHQIDMFNSVTRPTLLFRRAQDMAALGQKSRAVDEIMGLVRAHPEHPDHEAWMKKARNMLKSAGTSPQ